MGKSLRDYQKLMQFRKLIERAATLLEVRACEQETNPVKKKIVDILRKHLRKDVLIIVNRFSVVSLFQASKEVRQLQVILDFHLRSLQLKGIKTSLRR